MKKALLLTPLFLVFFILTSYASAYTVDTYVSNASSGSVITVDTISLNPDASTTCSVSLNSKTTLDHSGTFTLSLNYLSPDLTLLSTASATDLTSFSCRDFGTVSTTTEGANGYTGRVRYSHTATSGFSKLRATYSCTSPKNTIEFITSRSESDGKGFYPNAYMIQDDTNSDRSYASLFQNVSSCHNDWEGEPQETLFTSISCGTGTACSYFYIYPFNATGSGLVNIYANVSNETFWCIDGGTASNKKFDIDIVRANTPSESTSLYTTGWTTCGGGGTDFTTEIDNEYQLEENELYYLVFSGKHQLTLFAGNTMTLNVPQFINISIDTRTPNYVCESYGDCINGTQSRQCVDTSGFGFPNKLEFQSCGQPSVIGLERIGFENSYDVEDVLECEYYQIGALCGQASASRTVEIPDGWFPSYTTAFENTTNKTYKTPHFIQMTGDKASDGVRSMIMWYVPAGVQTVMSVLPSGEIDTGCQNVSSAPNQVLSKGFNASVLTNVTFNTSYVQISYDVAKIEEPLVRTYPTPWCGLIGYPTECYGSCTDDTVGRYRFLMTDTTNNQIILNIQDNVDSTQFIGRLYDLSNAGIQPNINYTVEIMLNPIDANDNRPIGIYMDNLRFTETSSAINCSSYCDDRNLIQASVQNGACILTTIVNETSCVEAILQAELDAERSIYQPVDYVSDVLEASGTNVTAIEDAGFGFVLSFVSPFFIVLLVILFMGGYLEYKIGKNSPSRGTIFGLTLLLGVIGATFMGLFPVGFALLFGVIGGMLVAYTLIKSFGG